MTHDQAASLIEQLSQDARALEARMLPDTGPLTQDHIEYARSEFLAFLDQAGFNAHDVSRSTNQQYSITTIDKYLRGDQVSDNIVRYLTRWMRQQRDALLDGAPSELVTTAVADEIIGIYSNTHRTRTMAIITGPSGCGKSTVAKTAAFGYIPGTLHIELPCIVRTGRQLLRFLAERIKVKGKSSAPLAQQRLVEHLEGTGRLIIIDECHFLNHNALLVLRDLHKLTGCPMVLQGTSTLINTINDFTEFKGQFRRLLSYVHEIEHERSGEDGADPLFTPEDVAKYIKSLRLRLTAGGRKLAVELVNQRDWGGLGKLTLVLLNCARVVAEDQPIDENVLWAVLSEMEGIRNTKRISVQVNQGRTRKVGAA